MLTFIAIAHIIIAIILVTLILLQDSKGGAMGVLGGGGGSNTIFGSTGAASFLVKATRGIAILFAITCFTLAYMTSQKSGSVFDGAPVTTQTPTKSNTMGAGKAAADKAATTTTGVAADAKATAEKAAMDAKATAEGCRRSSSNRRQSCCRKDSYRCQGRS